MTAEASLRVALIHTKDGGLKKKSSDQVESSS